MAHNMIVIIYDILLLLCVCVLACDITTSNLLRWLIFALVEVIIVQKVYTIFWSLSLSHTYISTKNVINMQIYCDCDIFKRNIFYFPNALK